MKTLLLLAGRSRRFWPLEDKMLFPIAGKTLLEHQVERLRKGGCTEIILVGGKHNITAAKKLFPDIPSLLQESEEWGMQTALLTSLLAIGSRPVLIVSGNDIVEPSAYATVVQAARGEMVAGALLARRMERYFPGGYLTLEGDRISGIVEKPGEGKQPSDLVNVVVHAHRDASLLLKELQKTKGDRDTGYERTLDRLFGEHVYRAVHYEGSWQAVKYPWHFLHLLPILLKEIEAPSLSEGASIHPSAVVEGNVIIEDGVRVLPHATVLGPSYISAHTVIGTGAFVRGASIGQRCVIGYNTEVKASVLSDHVWTHSTYIGDSVIGENVSFGAGCITGNLRLDEEEIFSRWEEQHLATGLSKCGAIIGPGCRIGIRVGIDPGVKIGRDTFVSGGLYLTEDTPEESFVKMGEREMEVRKNRTKAPRPETREKFFRVVELSE